MRSYAILQLRGAGVRFLEVAVALAIREFEHRRPKLTSRERRKIYSRTCFYLLMKASRVVLRGVRLRVLGYRAKSSKVKHICFKTLYIS